MSVKTNLETIQKEMETIAAFRRSPVPPGLIAVVKGQPLEKLQELYEAGQRTFAENRVQDLLKTYEAMKECEIQWHFIGHLQRNKVKYIIDKVAMIHSLDSLRLGVEISRRAQEQGSAMPCLVQVNTGAEDNKYGVEPEDCESLVRELAELPGLRISGLMAVTPFREDPEEVRPYFKNMYHLFTEIGNQNFQNVRMEYLSMGMSHDYRVAIEEGANMVRIGSRLFY